MNRTTISVLVFGTILLLGASVYFSDRTMPFGRGGVEMGEMQEHSDDLASYEISPSAVVKKMQANENIVLLDVRKSEEYEEVHLEGAVLLPVQELSQESLDKIGLGEDMKDKEIIIYGRSGARSKVAYNLMESLGYTNIKSVAGGMIHWEEDNYPLTESGPYGGSLAVGDVDNVTPVVEGAKITIDRTLHDFGEIAQYGGIVEAGFTITNEGTEVLTIGDITTSCSCTSATIEDNSIEPGASAELNVVFDPDFHAEPLDVFKRTVFIPTNDPNNAEAEVAISVDILEGQ